MTLRTAVVRDRDWIVAIRSTPEVLGRWGGTDLPGEFESDLADDDLHLLVIEQGGEIVGAIQWSDEPDEQYRHASIDIYVDPSSHGRGICTDAVATLAKHLFDEVGHHRIVIDPALDNAAAIACYRKVGFREVGVLRRYERGSDGTWHDGLLMELLDEDFAAR